MRGRGAVVPVWIGALGVTLLMQTVAAFLGQSLPVLAPLITASAGLSPQSIGNLTALVAAGTALFLLAGGPFLKRWGPVRSLQLGAALSAGAMLLAGTGSLPLLLAAALLLGIGYGPTPPAGSRILAATAPPQHRSLIFSLKQAGAPAGGALAGLIVAPVAAAQGWLPALLVTVATALVAALLIQPLQPRLDVERDPQQSLQLTEVLGWHSLRAPVAALRLHPVLPMLTALAVSFSLLQGCLFSFTVTWLIVVHRLDLVQAGFAFACLQAAGVVARILLGWLADRTGTPLRNLLAQAFAAMLCVLGLLLLPVGTPLPLMALVCGLAGFLAASWNGIYLAEVARLVPPEQIVTATAGSTLFTFLGYLAGPALFALGVWLSGGWTIPFVIAALQLGAVAAAMLLRRGGDTV